MISKEKIVEIIREETWVEVDSSRVYGIEEAAEKVLKIIEAAEQSAHPTKGGLVLRACVSAHCGWVGKESACLTWKHAGDERMCPHCQDNTESVSLSALRG